jgi:acetoin utilization protein AcuB
MIVGMYMTRDTETIPPETSLIDAIQKMSRLRIRRLVVTDNDAVVGMVCHRDLVEAFPHHINPFSPVAASTQAASDKVKTIMKHPVITISEDKPLEQAAKLMTERHIGALPVTSGGKLVGIITESDIFRALTEVLTQRPDSVRLTFDLNESENVLSFLAEATRKYNLTLLSFISFHERERRMAVTTVHGKRVEDLVGELWSTSHRIISILRSSSTS